MLVTFQADIYLPLSECQLVSCGKVNLCFEEQKGWLLKVDVIIILSFWS